MATLMDSRIAGVEDEPRDVYAPVPYGAGRGEFVKGLHRALGGTVGGVQALVGTGLEALGATEAGPAMQQRGLATIQDAQRYNPAAVGEFTDIGKTGNYLSDVADYVPSVLGEMVPSVATAMIGGGIGGAVVNRVGGTVALRAAQQAATTAVVRDQITKKLARNQLAGQFAGGALGMFPQEAGEAAAAYAADPTIMANPEITALDRLGMSTLKGGINAAAEAAVPVMSVNRIFGKVAPTVGKGEALKYIGKEVARNTGGEALTEGFQQLTGDVAHNQLNDEHAAFDPAAILNAAAAGAVGGAGMGGAMAGIKAGIDRTADNTKQAREQPMRAIAEATGTLTAKAKGAVDRRAQQQEFDDEEQRMKELIARTTRTDLATAGINIDDNTPETNAAVQALENKKQATRKVFLRQWAEKIRDNPDGYTEQQKARAADYLANGTDPKKVINDELDEHDNVRRSEMLTRAADELNKASGRRESRMDVYTRPGRPIEVTKMLKRTQEGQRSFDNTTDPEKRSFELDELIAERISDNLLPAQLDKNSRVAKSVQEREQHIGIGRALTNFIMSDFGADDKRSITLPNGTKEDVTGQVNVPEAFVRAFPTPTDAIEAFTKTFDILHSEGKIENDWRTRSKLYEAMHDIRRIDELQGSGAGTIDRNLTESARDRLKQAIAPTVSRAISKEVTNKYPSAKRKEQIAEIKHREWRKALDKISDEIRPLAEGNDDAGFASDRLTNTKDRERLTSFFGDRAGLVLDAHAGQSKVRWGNSPLTMNSDDAQAENKRSDDGETEYESDDLVIEDANGNAEISPSVRITGYRKVEEGAEPIPFHAKTERGAAALNTAKFATGGVEIGAVDLWEEAHPDRNPAEDAALINKAVAALDPALAPELRAKLTGRKELGLFPDASDFSSEERDAILNYYNDQHRFIRNEDTDLDGLGAATKELRDLQAKNNGANGEFTTYKTGRLVLEREGGGKFETTTGQLIRAANEAADKEGELAVQSNDASGANATYQRMLAGLSAVVTKPGTDFTGRVGYRASVGGDPHWLSLPQEFSTAASNVAKANKTGDKAAINKAKAALVKVMKDSEFLKDMALFGTTVGKARGAAAYESRNDKLNDEANNELAAEQFDGATPRHTTVFPREARVKVTNDFGTTKGSKKVRVDDGFGGDTIDSTNVDAEALETARAEFMREFDERPVTDEDASAVMSRVDDVILNSIRREEPHQAIHREGEKALSVPVLEGGFKTSTARAQALVKTLERLPSAAEMYRKVNMLKDLLAAKQPTGETKPGAYKPKLKTEVFNPVTGKTDMVTLTVPNLSETDRRVIYSWFKVADKLYNDILRIEAALDSGDTKQTDAAFTYARSSMRKLVEQPGGWAVGLGVDATFGGFGGATRNNEVKPAKITLQEGETLEGVQNTPFNKGVPLNAREGVEGAPSRPGDSNGVATKPLPGKTGGQDAKGLDMLDRVETAKDSAVALLQNSVMALTGTLDSMSKDDLVVLNHAINGATTEHKNHGLVRKKKYPLNEKSFTATGENNVGSTHIGGLADLSADQLDKLYKPSKITKDELKQRLVVAAEHIRTKLQERTEAETNSGRRESRMATQVHNDLGKSGFAATHDSPVRHEGKFNWEANRGTGEGSSRQNFAEDFGAGTYLSTADGVHKYYKGFFTAEATAGRGAAMTGYNAALPPTYEVTVRAEKKEIAKWDNPFSDALDNSEALRTAVEKLTNSTERRMGVDYHLTNTDPDSTRSYAQTTPKDILRATLNNDAIEDNDGFEISPTFEQVYEVLTKVFGDKAEVSKFFRSAGLVGHSYKSEGGKNSEHPNFVIYDDSRIETNYVHFSKQKTNAETADTAVNDPLTEDQKEALQQDILKRFGQNQITLLLDQNLGGISGDYDGVSVIRAALGVASAHGTVGHESMHHFFKLLIEQGNAQTRKVLENVANSPVIKRRLERLLHAHPEAQKQLENAEESVAYMFQFWLQADDNGKAMLDLGPETTTLFEKIKAFFTALMHKLRGTISDEGMAAEIMNAFEMGGAVTAEQRTMIEKGVEGNLKKLANVGKFTEMASKVIGKATFSAKGVMKMTKNRALIMLANQFDRESTSTAEARGFYDDVNRYRNIHMNALSKLLGGYKKEDIALAHQYLQEGKAPTDHVALEIFNKVHDHLENMHNFMNDRSVMRRSEDNAEWEPLGYRKGYFMQSWDTDLVRKGAEEFKNTLFDKHADKLEELAEQANAEVAAKRGHGPLSASTTAINNNDVAPLTADDIANAIIERIQSTGGQIEQAAGESDVGTSPVMKNINRRTLNWLDSKAFNKFKNQDLIGLLNTYTNQAVKRGVFTEQFGNGGWKMQDTLGEAHALEIGGEEMAKKAAARLVKLREKHATEVFNARKEKRPVKGFDPEYMDALHNELFAQHIAPNATEAEQITGAKKVQEIEDAAKAKLADAVNMIRAMEGTLGREMNAQLRSALSWATTYESWRLLMLTLFTSINDVAGVVTRGGTLSDGWDTFVTGIKEVQKTWRRDYSQSDMAEYSARIGTAAQHAALDSLGSAYDSSFMTGGAQRANDTLFHVNGVAAWDRGVRIGATGAAISYITRLSEGKGKHSARHIAELYGENGKPVLKRDGTLDLEAPSNQIAIHRWVVSAVITPNGARRTGWMSDPHFVLFSHLKSYTYSFHAQILKRVYSEAVDHGNFDPALKAMLLYVPIAIAADAFKELVMPTDAAWTKGGLVDYLSHGVSRAGLGGIPQMYTGGIWDQAKALFGDGTKDNNNGVLGLAGPVPNQIYNAVMPTALGGEAWSDFGQGLAGALPGGTIARRVYRKAEEGGEE